MKLKKSIKSEALKCLVVGSEVVKLLLLSRKLENLKNFFLKVNVYIKATFNKRFDSRKLVRLAVKNMNNIRSQARNQESFRAWEFSWN